MTKRKRIPTWYRLYLERRVKKLETALTWLDYADNFIRVDAPIAAARYINAVKTILK